MSFYSKNELEADWYAFELADEVARTAAAEKEAGWAFERATRTQKAEYDAAMSNLIGIAGPLWDRKREDIRAKWHNDTAAARVLFDKSVAEIIDTGEISEETNAAWDAITPKELAPKLQIVRAA
jgi:hypothetical protein